MSTHKAVIHLGSNNIIVRILNYFKRVLSGQKQNPDSKSLNGVKLFKDLLQGQPRNKQRATVYQLVRTFLREGSGTIQEELKELLKQCSTQEQKVAIYEFLRCFLTEEPNEECVVLREDRSIYAYIVPPELWKRRLLAQKLQDKTDQLHRKIEYDDCMNNSGHMNSWPHDSSHD